MSLSIAERCIWIKSKVSMNQVFDEYGIHHQNISIPHQVNCPFHDDIHASARFFPSQNNGSGSFHCWACDMGGDIIWFVKEWHQYDSLLLTLSDIETTFGLQRTTDDVVADFYKARSSFDKRDESPKLTEAHFKLVEVQAVGRLKDTDPSPPASALLKSLSRTPETLTRLLKLWAEFDKLVDFSLPYDQAVELTDAWLERFNQEIEQWRVAEDTESKQEQ